MREIRGGMRRAGRSCRTSDGDPHAPGPQLRNKELVDPPGVRSVETARAHGQWPAALSAGSLSMETDLDQHVNYAEIDAALSASAWGGDWLPIPRYRGVRRLAASSPLKIAASTPAWAK